MKVKGGPLTVVNRGSAAARSRRSAARRLGQTRGVGPRRGPRAGQFRALCDERDLAPQRLNAAKQWHFGKQAATIVGWSRALTHPPATPVLELTLHSLRASGSVIKSRAWAGGHTSVAL